MFKSTMSGPAKELSELHSSTIQIKGMLSKRALEFQKPHKGLIMTDKAPTNMKLDFKDKLQPKHLIESDEPILARQMSPKGKGKNQTKNYEFFQKNHLTLKQDNYSW